MSKNKRKNQNNYCKKKIKKKFHKKVQNHLRFNKKNPQQ